MWDVLRGCRQFTQCQTNSHRGTDHQAQWPHLHWQTIGRGRDGEAENR
jgi:hypothetical protein